MKKVVAILLALTFVLVGCEKDEWQTVSCDIPVYEGNVFRDGEKLTYGESRNIDGTQSISFKLPTGYYQTENTGDYETEKTWTDGETTVAIYGVKLVDAKEYFEYCEYSHPYLRTTSGREIAITSLNNGVIESYYPSDETEKSTTHIHFVDATLGEYVIRFTVYEHCPKDSSAISDETIEFIQTIANSFECTAEMVMNESEISPEDLALAEKAAVDFGKLHNVEEWDNAEEDIPVHMFVYWYLEYVNSITTYEERVERYTPTFWKYGWAYPQEEFEAYIQKYFNVSTEYLRSGDCYYADEGVYLLDQIGGANLGYKVRLSETKPTVDGDIMYIPMELSFNGDFRDTAYRTLVIQKTEDGYKYLECFEYEKKVEFPKFSLYLTSGYGVEGETIFYNSLTSIKFIETYPATERDSVYANAEKEYKESEFFVKESEYSDDRLSWKEYTVQIPLPEESGLDLVDNFSYYFVSYKDMIIKFETRPVIYGMGGSQRDKIEDILKTIEYID